MDFVRFAILGLGAGAIYGLTALGVVIIYRGSGVLNFAQGAVGMVGAYLFYDARASGVPTVLAWVEAVGLGILIGALTHLLVMRPLRAAPVLSRIIATLGLLTILLGYAQHRYGLGAKIVPKLLPIDAVEVLPDISIGKDRLIILGIGVALTVALSLGYRYLRFGLATSAVAQSRRVTAAQGISPDLVATMNWGLGSGLAVVAAILIVNIAQLQVVGLTLLVVPAFAAALVGGFRSFSLTFAGGLLIGFLEAEVQWLQIYLTRETGHPFSLEGWTESIPFIVIILVLVVRGRALPLRGEGIERPPEVGNGRVRPLAVGAVIALVVVAVTTLFSTDLVESVTTTSILAIVVLSLVVVTGYTGQLSLAQFALAGMGAWFAVQSIVTLGFPFELAFVAGVVAAVPVGILVGLPSLRTRGVNLAVATLGLALIIQSQILANSTRTGGIIGLQIGAPRFFGIDFDTFRYPERYALLSFGCFVVVALLVANLRRGRAGRRLIAVRTNERAAASLGIGVFGAKLYAFGLSAAIAAVGGILLGFRRPNVTFFPTFSIFESIFVVVYAVIGGIGFVVGAALGASLAPAAILPVAGGSVFSTDTVRVVLGIVLVLVLITIPNGLASLSTRLRRAVDGRRRVPKAYAVPVAPPPLARVPVTPRVLEVHDVGVRFGGVVALDGVSLAVRPGEITGLIGPNGAGKTTLIDVVTGFTPCSSGEVTLDGVVVNKWSPRRRAVAGIGRSFQSLELFESMSVRDNLRAASERRDMRSYVTDLFHPGRAGLSPTAWAAVQEVGLASVLDRRPEELPYGTRRLVAIARAVAANPSVLLLDEPAAGLDVHETAELELLVRRLAREWGIAVLLVEHDVALVFDVCDRVAVLEFGRQIADGPADAVRHEAAVVRAYLGAAITAPDAAPSRPEPVPDPASRVPTADATPIVRVVPDARNASTASPSRSPVPAVRPVPLVPLVESRSLSAGYGDLAVVHGLSLEVHPGEVVALLGPNGAGKTTTLLTLAGELAPLAGELRWHGRAVSARWMPLHRRVRDGLGYVPQDRAVVAALTTAGNLRLARVEVTEALALFSELEPLLRRRAGLLSGGEQQMLTLARALASKPSLLLVDELSQGLAPQIIERLLSAVRVAANRGVGVLLVEQHARAALGIADRVYVMRQGRIELSESAASLREHFERVEDAYLGGSTPG